MQMSDGEGNITEVSKDESFSDFASVVWRRHTSLVVDALAFCDIHLPILQTRPYGTSLLPGPNP